MPRLLLASLATAIAASSFSTSALSDTLGFRVGGYSWQQDYSGEVQTDNDLQIDINDDLGLDDESGNTLFVSLEHPIPVLPNVLIQHTELDVEENNILTREITFSGVTYAVSDEVNSDIDLSHTDATLYYEVLDNWIHVDFGLTVRQFDGGVNISSSTDASEEEIEEIIPMLYLAARVELPLTGFYVGASANGISAGDATLTDLQVNVGYETDIGLGIEAGFRDFTLDYEDDGDEADISVDGAYIGIFYHF